MDLRVELQRKLSAKELMLLIAQLLWGKHASDTWSFHLPGHGAKCNQQEPEKESEPSGPGTGDFVVLFVAIVYVFI